MFGWGTSLSLSLSLLALFSTLKFLNALFVRFCALFVILSLCKKATQRVARRKPQQKNPQRLKENLPFLDTSLALSMTNSGFCLKITDIFTQSLGTKFTNFTRFYGLPRSLCSLAMTADFVILSVAKNPKNLRYALFMDTSLALSMTARQKFKFFTQNSRHFINSAHFINSKHFTNSTHFINLTQISSLTQGFFIFLPQVFAQCKLIKNFLQGGHCV